MKILYIASTFGHIRSFHLPYIKEIIAKGHSVDVAGAGASDGMPAEARCISLAFEKSMGSVSNFKTVARLTNLMKKHNYDLIIMHTSLAAFFTRLAVRCLPKEMRPRTVNMVHGYLFDSRTPFLKRTLLLTAEKLTAAVTNRLIIMNDEDEKIALSHHLCVSDSEIHKIAGVGYDSHRFFVRDEIDKTKTEGDTFNMICAAEFSSRKNQAFLLYVLKGLEQADPKTDYHLTLAGRGAELEACKVLASKLCIADKVSFPGFITNIEDYYAKNDVSISASRSEGLPFNVLEALACGLPVVASDVKGHVDLIRPGENGELYEFGNIESCITAILRARKILNSYKPTNGIESYALDTVFDTNLSLIL